MENSAASEAITSQELLDRINALTSRETEVLGLVIKGLSNDQIALALFRSPKTVDKHCQRIFRKLGINRRVNLVRHCMEAGYQPVQDSGNEVPTRSTVEPIQPVCDYQIIDELVQKGKAWDRLVNYEQLLINASGPQYFGELVCALCKSFGVRAAGISECTRGGECGVIIAYSTEGERVLEIEEYELEGTPCNHVTDDGVFFQASGLQETFPEDEFLVEKDFDSYAGVRLDDRILGPIGLLWICDNKPMPTEHMYLDVMKIIAPSVAAELGVQITLDQAEQD